MNSTGERAILSTPSDREIRIERTFEATRSRVWQAYTDPALVAQWWGRGKKLIIERLEVKRGGHWRFVVVNPGGTQGFEGRFREVVPEERLVQTAEWDGLPGYVAVDTVEFIDLGDGRTKVVTTSLFFTVDERNSCLESPMEIGLNDSYNALDRVLADLK
jgi:uncharacterized protein YndB with AHSA1/START domain